jgi:hypothetical protein
MKIHNHLTTQERSNVFDLRFHPCPFDSAQIEMIGFVKVAGGIKYLVGQFKFRSSDDALNEIHRSGIFSPRPYQLGQACDGSITVCVFALFYRFCQEQGHLPNALIRAAFPKQDMLPDWTNIIASAEWQGVTYPKKWDSKANAGLFKSLHEINYHRLAALVSDLMEGGSI